jgi:lysophospholipase L1-like esterase
VVPTTPTSTPTPAPSPPPRPTVAFLGDDYTTGVGASRAGNGFVPLLGQALDVPVRTFGAPGAGYARPRGHPRRTYASEVAAVVASKPDIVVVSGGRNDFTDLLATFRTAARQLFATLHAKLPHAELAAVAPWWGDSPHPPELRVLDAPVRTAVLAAGGHYLNVPDPLTGHRNWMADSADPNDAGYRAIATSLTPALHQLIADSTG